MRNKEELMTMNEFSNKHPRKSRWWYWLYDKIMGNSDMSQYRSLANIYNDNTYYIVMPTLITITKTIIRDHYKLGQRHPSDHLFTLTQFKSRYAHRFIYELELTDIDIMLILQYLCYEYGVAIINNIKGYNNTYTVKYIIQ